MARTKHGSTASGNADDHVSDRVVGVDEIIHSHDPEISSDEKEKERVRRACRQTFSMTDDDIHLIDKMIIRVMLDAGVRLNKSEVLRLGLLALESIETQALKPLTLALKRLNKRG